MKLLVVSKDKIGNNVLSRIIIFYLSAPSSTSNQFKRRGGYYGGEQFLTKSKHWLGFVEVPEGLHTYNCELQLPVNIPSSVEGAHGHIRYRVEAELEVSWSLNLKAYKPFTVIRIEDLNNFPELRQPYEVQEIKKFCSLFCSSNPLSIRICMPRTGFSVCEKIPLSFELNNQSSRNVAYIAVILFRVDQYTSHRPSEEIKEVRTKIIEERFRGVKARTKVAFEENFDLPNDLLLSNDRYCRIFRITYELKFVVQTVGFNISPRMLVPITIGSIGLQGYEFKTVAPFNAKSKDQSKKQ